jgi:hypothetical protein
MEVFEKLTVFKLGVPVNSIDFNAILLERFKVVNLSVALIDTRSNLVTAILPEIVTD